jgi:hypothetical protein
VTFNLQTELDNHLKNFEANGCENLLLPSPKGITPGVMAQISERCGKKGRRPTNEQLWFEIYHLIFPDDPDPVSACKI